ncbi:MAG TPA: RHS repeat-associated core domain-containing protein [Terriglobia bacterium]|nr:RHS repeat-associated core domain-containing protein [Terriglobia bacterium]
MSCTVGSSGYCPQVTFDNTTNRITKIGSATVSHDAAGDMTGDGVDTYQYDGEGRLISMDGGSTATFQYNALGWRVYWPNNSNLSYWYGPDGNSLGGSWGSNWNAFLWFDGRELADYEGDGAHFPHANTLDSTTQTTNWSGGGTQEIMFYPWGQIWQQTSGYFAHEVFAGLQDADPSLGVYQTLNRRFQPLLGRWMTPDPLSGDVTNPQSLNRYAYVKNNPTSLTDPLGLQSGGLEPRTCGGNRLKIPNGVDALSYCKTHMGFYGGNSSSSYFSNNTDEFDLLGPTYIGNGEGGLMPALITNGGQVANWLNDNTGSFSGGWLSYNLGTLKLQTKVFFSTLGQNFMNEFNQGGCVNAFLEGVERADVLGPALSGSPNIAETNINALANGVAVNYAAGKLLTVPFRSSTVRSILNTGETAAEYFAPVYLDYLTAYGFFGKEVPAIVRGKCQ